MKIASLTVHFALPDTPPEAFTKRVSEAIERCLDEEDSIFAYDIGELLTERTVNVPDPDLENADAVGAWFTAAYDQV